MRAVVFHNVIAAAPDMFDRGLGRVRIDRFRRDLEALRDRYAILPLDAALDAAPDRPVATITFDDGFAGVYHHARPVLDDLGLVATVFVMTEPGGAMQPDRLLHFERLELGFRLTAAGALDATALGLGPLALDTTPARFTALKRIKRVLKLLPEAERAAHTAGILDALGVDDDRVTRHAAADADLRFRKLALAEVRALQAAGWTIGGHSRSHRTLSRLGDAELRDEVVECARDLAAIGIHRAPFAYPYGGDDHVDDRAAAMVAEAGFTMAFTTSPRPTADRYRLGRDATLWWLDRQAPPAGVRS